MLEAVTGAADPSNNSCGKQRGEVHRVISVRVLIFQAKTTALAVHKTADSPTVYSAGSNCVLT